MTSKAEATFTCKSFGPNLLPKEAPTAGVGVQLKKKANGTLLTLQFNDASLQDPKSLKGVVLSAERKFKGGVKGTAAYTPANQDALVTVTFDKKIGDNDVTMKGSYQLKGDVFQLQETWKFDKNNKVVGNYNFAKEELTLSYEHTRGSLKLGGQYNLKTEKPLLSLEKKEGKNTLTATYGPKDEAATLSWQHKPFKAVLRGKAGKGGVKGVSASLLLTHEFEL